MVHLKFIFILILQGVAPIVMSLPLALITKIH